MGQLFSSFGVDWKLLIAQAVNFAILFYLLKRFAYAPVLAMLKRREDIVRKGMDDATAAGTERANVHVEANTIRGDAKKEAHALLVEAHGEATNILESARTEGKVKKEEIIYSAQKDIEDMRLAGMRAVGQKAADYIVATVRTILKEEMTSDMNARIIAKLTQK